MTHPHVDPALLPLIDGFPPIDVSAETLAGFREAFAAMSAMPDPATHPDVRIDTVSVSGIRTLLYRPVGAASPGALLHLHGGGFVMGSPEMDAARNIDLVRSTGATILSPDYRLAPEHPHPAALEDALAVLVWLQTAVRSLGASTRIGLIGESAGGGLAASLALQARDRSIALDCQILIYPMLMPPAASIDTATPDARTGRHIWTRASNAFCWSVFHTDAAAAGVAGLTRDLRSVAPAFIAVGELDLFVHDDLAYAGRLLAAGVPVEAHLYPGAIHGFDRMTDAPVSRRYTRDLVDYVQRAFAPR